jgi:hypothetical protein
MLSAGFAALAQRLFLLLADFVAKPVDDRCGKIELDGQRTKRKDMGALRFSLGREPESNCPTKVGINTRGCTSIPATEHCLF